MTNRARWFERYSWCLFFGIGILLLAYGVYLFLLPTLRPQHWSWLTTDSQVTAYIAGDFRWFGVLVTGLGVFVLGTSLMAFREGRTWAWYVCWYLPVAFLLGSFVTWAAVLFVPLLLLSVLGLVLPMRRFLPKRNATEEPKTPGHAA